MDKNDVLVRMNSNTDAPRTNTFPEPASRIAAGLGAVGLPAAPASFDRPASEYNDAERDIMAKAAASGLTFANPGAVLKFAGALLGNVRAKPIMWLMETHGGAVSHTHYEAVAKEYSTRPGYVVTPIYSHVAKGG